MGQARLLLYVLGLLIVVAGAWVLLTQTPFADEIPAGVALALILLLVGIGIMVSARALDDTSYTRRRVVHRSELGSTGERTVYDRPPVVGARSDAYEPGERETIVEERRY